jgi:hypothetical protein
MQDLLRTLSDYDLEMLRVIANRWDVDIESRDQKKAAEHLTKAMLKPEKVTDIWDRLTDEQRGALQTLLGAGGKMPTAIFGRMYGEIRPMGPGKLEREKPYLNPASLTEALYYRGLLSTTFGAGLKGSQQAWTFVPTDLQPLMPVHKTGYKVEDEDESPSSSKSVQPNNIRASDTSLVDDMTTLLAYLQLNSVALVEANFPPDHQKAIKPYLLGSNSPARLALLVAIAGGMGIAAEVDGLFKPVANAARKWLEMARSEQVRAMAEAWRDSVVYNELWFTPGIKPERASWQNDPLLARQTVLTFMEMVAIDNWWPVDTFVNVVKEDEPDFQRPGGDYDSWYIRDAQTGNYLRGFDTWDKVDGAMLRFILIGPMHGLGLVDTADNGGACKLTAYGRAFTGASEWPTPQPENGTVTIQPDGLCLVPRSASRFDRFQLARFTEWGKAEDPYQYRISTAGLAQAAEQNITADKILPFLKRCTNDQIPDTIINLIETWGQGGNEAAVIEQVTVLRVPSEELLETIQANPALRRYLGAALGPMAVIVRNGQWNNLAAALEASGVLVQVEVMDS